MRRLSFVILFSVLAMSRPVLADEPPAKPADEKEVILKALDYVGTKSIAWLRVKKCASCHHVPMMVWAQREARDRGYPIDEDGWREATDFLLKEPRASLEQTPENDGVHFSPGAGFTLLAFRQGSEKLGMDSQAALNQAAAHLVSTQQADGSWTALQGHPPIYGVSQEATTLFAAFVLEATRTSERDVAANQARANEWLAANSKVEDEQADVWRILSVHDREASVDRLLKRQNSDGGWSQTREMASDAYATGQAVYALVSRGGLHASAPAIAKARDFLFTTQMPDGSWPMTSRPHLVNGGIATSREPITVAATGWAVLGLLQGTPPVAPAVGGPTARIRLYARQNSNLQPVRKQRPADKSHMAISRRLLQALQEFARRHDPCPAVVAERQ